MIVFCSTTQSQETGSVTNNNDVSIPYYFPCSVGSPRFFFSCLFLGEDEIDPEGRYRRYRRAAHSIFTGTRQRENPSVLPASPPSSSQSQSLQGRETEVTKHEAFASNVCRLAPSEDTRMMLK